MSHPTPATADVAADPRPNRATLDIDLAAAVANYQRFVAASHGGEVGAVVKADAYGLGLEALSVAFWGAGCRAFFVATCEEGERLRGQCPAAVIYVFEGVRPDSLDRLLAAGLVPVLNQPQQARRWAASGGAPCAVHVDTGMNRLGFADDLQASALDGCRPTLLMTHLACADQPEHPHNRQQLDRFDAVRRRFPELPVSIGNSAAWLSGADRQGDLGRPGIGLYGGNPFVTRRNDLRPVATLSGRVLQVRERGGRLPERVGYGATAAAPERLAVINVGYADGLPRLLSNRGAVVLQGHRCPIVGRVSMDLTTVDIGALPVCEGDRAEFFGPQLGVDEVAGWADTVAYEVLTGLGHRPERRYCGSDAD